MRVLAGLVIGLFGIFTHAANLSKASHDHAVEVFKETSFFAKGRGMHMSPGLITHFNKVMDKAPAPDAGHLDLRTWFTQRWGLNFEDKNVVGLFEKDYQKLKVGAVGCVACHSGKAAGRLIIGLGNKNIDVVQMAKDVYRLEKWWKKLIPASKKSESYKDVEEAALRFAQYLGDDDIGNLTQGLVPVSFIRGWFYRVHGEDYPKDLSRGQVKVPALWGYGKKREVGQFCDGYGDGEKVGWAVAVELAAGQRPEVVREMYEEVEHAEELFSDFLPPAYPYKIDESLAARGKDIFYMACARCHGTYEKDAQGYPIYKSPRHIPWVQVQTDFDRLAGNTDEFNQKVKESPLADIIRFIERPYQGYFAPRLEGVWARFPYLHNSSVPNLKALLTKPDERPRVFSLRNSGEEERYDPKLAGLTVPKDFVQRSLMEWLGRKGKRWVYWTEREGHSNQGHDFATDYPEEDKLALIEYLKSI